MTCDFLNEWSRLKRARTSTPRWGNVDIFSAEDEVQRHVWRHWLLASRWQDVCRMCSPAGCVSRVALCRCTFRSVGCRLGGIVLAQILWELCLEWATCTVVGNSTARYSGTGDCLGDALVMQLVLFVLVFFWSFDATQGTAAQSRLSGTLRLSEQGAVTYFRPKGTPPPK